MKRQKQLTLKDILNMNNKDKLHKLLDKWNTSKIDISSSKTGPDEKPTWHTTVKIQITVNLQYEGNGTGETKKESQHIACGDILQQIRK